MTVLLSAAAYELGEIEIVHTELPRFTERLRQSRIPDQPALWGWGQVRRTTRSVAELAVASGCASLAMADADADAVDAVLLCCTRFEGGPDTHGSFVGEVMAGLELPRAVCTGITLNRCTNLLVGIDIASAWVASGRHRQVLVITTDRVAGEDDRFEDFALFSDGAASCLIANDAFGDPAYEVLGNAAAQDNADLDWSHEISPQLARQVNEDLRRLTAISTDGIATVLSANLFLPLQGMKERQAGFSVAQLDNVNTARFGHCFAADPLINLADRATRGDIADGSAYLLAVSVPGSRRGVLLRARTNF